MQVQCGRCGARYAFAADAIPEEGYEAACSQCEHTFFVAPGTAAEARPERVRSMQAQLGREAHEQLGRPRRKTLDSLFEDDLHRGPAEDEGDDALEPAPNDTPVRREAPPPASRRSRGEDIEREWAQAPLVPPGQPTQIRAPQAPAAPLYDEAAAAYGRRRREAHRAGLEDVPERPTRSRARLLVGLSAATFVAVGVVVGVVQSQSLHAPTQVTPPVRIVRDPPPEAARAFDDGLRALKQDNLPDLLVARDHFQRAIDEDATFTDAWAGLGLASMLAAEAEREAADEGQRHVDRLLEQARAQVAAQGRDATAVHEGAADAKAESAGAAALTLAASSLRMRGTVHELTTLERRLAPGRTSAWSLQAAAAAALMHAVHLPVQTPLLATAMALWQAQSGPTFRASMAEELTNADQLVGQLMAPERRAWLASDAEPAPAPKPRAAPFAAWRLLARSRAAMPRRDDAPGPEAYQPSLELLQQAVALEPGLRRVTFALAEVLVLAARTDEAKGLLRELTEQSPAHERARTLLSQLP